MRCDSTDRPPRPSRHTSPKSAKTAKRGSLSPIIVGLVQPSTGQSPRGCAGRALELIVQPAIACRNSPCFLCCAGAKDIRATGVGGVHAVVRRSAAPSRFVRCSSTICTSVLFWYRKSTPKRGLAIQNRRSPLDCVGRISGLRAFGAVADAAFKIPVGRGIVDGNRSRQ